MPTYPYAEQFEIQRGLGEEGMDRATILEALEAMASAEDQRWETGQCSGTMYCGDHDHYDFLNEAFAKFSHVNALQRDMCPSSTKFEAEIIAMTLDLLGAGQLPTAAGLVTSGGTGSIIHAVLAYREFNAARTTRPNLIKPETAHPAFNKAGHLLGVEIRVAPVDPVTTQVDLDWVAEHVDDDTVALVGSACNYGYGTVDPIAELGAWRWTTGSGSTSTGASVASSCRSARSSATTIADFDFSVPGVTTISADTHKYGYSLKGTSVLCFADKALRNAQYFFQTDWSGGQVLLARHGRLTLRRAARGDLGRDGQPRTGRLPPLRRGDLRDLGGHAGSGPLASGAAGPRRAHASCSRSPPTTTTCTTSTTSCGRGAGA